MRRRDQFHWIPLLVYENASPPNWPVYHHFDGIPKWPHFCPLCIVKHFAMVFRSCSFVRCPCSVPPHWNVQYPNSNRATTILFPAYLCHNFFWKIRPIYFLRRIWSQWIDVMCHFSWTVASQMSRQLFGNSQFRCRCHLLDRFCRFYCFWRQYFDRSVLICRKPDQRIFFKKHKIASYADFRNVVDFSPNLLTICPLFSDSTSLKSSESILTAMNSIFYPAISNYFNVILFSFAQLLPNFVKLRYLLYSPHWFEISVRSGFWFDRRAKIVWLSCQTNGCTRI